MLQGHGELVADGLLAELELLGRLGRGQFVEQAALHDILLRGGQLADGRKQHFPELFELQPAGGGFLLGRSRFVAFRHELFEQGRIDHRMEAVDELVLRDLEQKAGKRILLPYACAIHPKLRERILHDLLRVFPRLRILVGKGVQTSAIHLVKRIERLTGTGLQFADMPLFYVLVLSHISCFLEGKSKKKERIFEKMKESRYKNQPGLSFLLDFDFRNTTLN